MSISLSKKTRRGMLPVTASQPAAGGKPGQQPLELEGPVVISILCKQCHKQDRISYA